MATEAVTPELVVTKTPLTRKALIVAGATVGLILAGGLAFLKTRTDADETVSDESSES